MVSCTTRLFDEVVLLIGATGNMACLFLGCKALGVRYGHGMENWLQMKAVLGMYKQVDSIEDEI